MQDAFLPIFLFAIVALGLALGLLLLSRLFNPGRPGRVIRMPYESGMDPIHDTRRRFDVRFHLLAIAFLVFDVELLFLYPWAVAASHHETEQARRMSASASSEVNLGNDARIHPTSTDSSESRVSRSSPRTVPQGIDAAVAAGWVENRHLVFAGAMTFLALLALGFVYDWRKGIFRWH